MSLTAKPYRVCTTPPRDDEDAERKIERHEHTHKGAELRFACVATYCARCKKSVCHACYCGHSLREPLLRERQIADFHA